MTSPAPQPPPRRADAERNRERILTAARAAFAESDGEVSMAEISRRAGVGMATLYRNFSSRQELLEALYMDEVDAVCRAAETVTGDTAAEVFMAWLRRFFVYFTSKRHVAAELIEQSGSDNPVFGAGRPRVIAAGLPLLVAAQDAHELRADLTLDQIVDMIAAIAKIPGDPRYLEPILDATLDGLRRQPADVA
ncbi:MAG TPA: helix-turn-helix domain-containing protein [Solirubrobacteraceae bacterium]|nr:helix-turn-helix domain-containing protein [Solirubrobacteraceae bacterium]